ncbi:glycosyltransferase [Microbacterium rhizomatis]|uniref:4,4'-diaponeurosporenoate glycosyltransferase n=1 Tax=Microbacterium rhizomatis TaxID=1631477 RepID=A0A5J5J145_9MICO|nr:glycosyltransferase [Microbacterium rhizomatis]KAA9107704.1 glycosyltransferase [Microbacterium rhizomatis]
MSVDAVTRVIVVVPVHNEEDLLDACLGALSAAVHRTERAGLACDVRVVLDDCTDASATLALSYPFTVSTIRASMVGAARAHGVVTALADLGDVDLHRVWIANTDADSQVPPQWIVDQVRIAALGTDVVLGGVRPDFADLTPVHRRHWLRTHPRGVPTGNVHGANLGIRADAYVLAGGFPAVAEHEDVQLVERARVAGARIGTSAHAPVVTSGRQIGRTPGGYAAFVRTLAADLERRTVDAE